MQTQLTFTATPYGAAPYFLTLAADGTVVAWHCPLLDQPPALLKLTFGADWELARTFFADLGELVALQTAVVLGAEEPPRFLAELWSAFRTNHPDHVMADEATEARRSFWRANAAFFPYYTDDPVVLDATRRNLFELANRKRKAIWRRPLEERAAVLPHLLLLRRVLPPEMQAAALRAIGALDLPAADDFLFAAFHAPRRTLEDQEFLRAIEESDYYRNAARLRAIYQPKRFDAETLALFLRVLNRKRDAENVSVALRILERRPHLADAVYPVLRRNDYPERYAVLHAAFVSSRENNLTDDLFGLIRHVAPPEHQLGLADLYAKHAEPALSSMPAVTWPQSLFQHHRAASEATPKEILRRLIADNLAHPAARVRYVALLELYRAEISGLRILEEDKIIQAHVLTAVASRTDKVSASALRLLSRFYDGFADPATIVRAIVPLTVRARYQTQLYKILRGRAGSDVALAVQAETFGAVISGLESETEAQAVRQILKFLKGIPGQTNLLRQLAARETELGAQIES